MSHLYRRLISLQVHIIIDVWCISLHEELNKIYVDISYCAGAEILICDFHRKQAWWRWTSAIKNNVSNSRDDILKALNVSTCGSTVYMYKKCIIFYFQMLHSMLIKLSMSLIIPSHLYFDICCFMYVFTFVIILC